MNKVSIGLVFLVLGIWGSVSWWWFILDILKGVLVLVLLVAGLLLIGLGVKDIGAPAAETPAGKRRRTTETDNMVSD